MDLMFNEVLVFANKCVGRMLERTKSEPRLLSHCGIFFNLNERGVERVAGHREGINLGACERS